MKLTAIEPLESRIAPATVVITGGSVVEGSGDRYIDFTVSVVLDDGETDLSGSIDVSLFTEDGSAHKGTDFEEITKQITFSPGGALSDTFRVKILNDNVGEFEESFLAKMTFSGAITGETTSGQAGGVIKNDDATIKISDVSVVENGGPAKFKVELSHPVAVPLTIDYTTEDGTAKDGSDYTKSTGTITFAPNETSKDIEIALINDSIDEVAETFSVKLSNLVIDSESRSFGSADDLIAVGKITNDDRKISIVEKVSLPEGSSGTRNFSFTVSLDGPASEDITFKYSTAQGSAISVPITDSNGAVLDPADFVGADHILVTIPKGQSSATIVVQVKADNRIEGDESFTVTLETPTNAVIEDGKGVATGTIESDDPKIEITDVTVMEGNGGTKTAVFFVSLGGDPGKGNTVTVDFKTNNGTATAKTVANPYGDYLETTGQLTFDSDNQVRTISVPIVGDLNREALLNQFQVELTKAVYSVGSLELKIADPIGIGTIRDDDLTGPTISVTDVSQLENHASGKMIFVVKLSQPSDYPVTVNYQTKDDANSAKGGVDYTSLPTGTLTFNPGQTELTVEVLITNDTDGEANERFFLELSEAKLKTGDTTSETLTISKPLGIGTIKNDDTQVTISDGSLIEGKDGAKYMEFKVTLNAKSEGPVTLTYDTADGTAKAGSDYVASKAGTLVIAAGETEGTIKVEILDDNIYEPGDDENFSITISDVQGAEMADKVAKGVIEDNENAPKVSIVAPTGPVTELNSGSSPKATFEVRLDHASTEDIVVHYKTVLGSDPDSATNIDFVEVTDATVTIKAGQTSAKFDVTILGDNRDELDQEKFKVELVSVNGAGGVIDTNANTAIGIIQDDDASPTITITDVSQLEGVTVGENSTFTFKVKLSAASDKPITVDYKTIGNGAVEGVDYVGKTGTLTFAPGDTEEDITITVNNDGVAEGDVQFLVNLENATGGAVIADKTGVGKILNDDSKIKVEIVGETDGAIKISEGATSKQVTFRVTLENPVANADTTVFYSTIEGTAKSSGARPDYVGKSGTLVWKAGATGAALVQDITVDIIDDLNYEGDESFILKLSNALNANLEDDNGTVTITSDDAQPKISISDATIIEGDSGSSKISFKVKLSAANEAEAVTVDYQTVDDTAVSTGLQDYLSANGTLTFAVGETEKTITIDVYGDARDEDNQQFKVLLSNPDKATIDGSGEAKGTIVDNDAAPILSITDVTLIESEGGESNKAFVINLKNAAGLAAASEKDITVHYKTVSYSAEGNKDFKEITDEILVIKAGQTSATIETSVDGVEVINDTTDELDEVFYVQLFSPTNATIGRGLAAGVIQDDDASPIIAINDASITEGDNGFSTIEFTVSISAASTLPIAVDYTTANLASGSIATFSGDFYDYIAQSGRLVFTVDEMKAGVLEKHISIRIVNDTYKELDEQFEVKLGNAINATIVDGSGVGTILNGDDTKIGLVLKDGYIAEGSNMATNATKNEVTFTVQLSAPAEGAVNFKLGTQNGTAVAGTGAGFDYEGVAPTGQSIANGVSSATYKYKVNNDTAWEATEMFFLNLTDASSNVVVVDNDALGTNQATARGYILNDDAVLLNARTLQWIDVDGDLVTLTVSKGTLTGNEFTFEERIEKTVNDAGQYLGGRILNVFDLTQSNGAFAGANITITASKQAGFPGDGDGRVNVGFINSAVFSSNEFQILGWDLGTVKVDGDLAMITAGDAFSTAAISKLDVYSLGVNGAKSLTTLYLTTDGDDAGTDPDDLPTAAALRASPTSNILGPITSINITQNLQGYLHVIGAQYGNIGTIKIGGNLQGGAYDGSGRIEVTGKIASVTVGNIIGGNGIGSGSIATSLNVVGSSLGTIKVLGNVVGGFGDYSGTIASTKIGNVTIEGSLVGGNGDKSGRIGISDNTVHGTYGKLDYIVGGTSIGSVTIGGDILGGASTIGDGLTKADGDTELDEDDDIEWLSGTIMAASIGPIKVGGSVVGGEAFRSGSIIGNTLKTVTIGGALIGGSGHSGSILVAVDHLTTDPFGYGDGSVGAIVIGKNAAGDSIRGGYGVLSGAIRIDSTQAGVIGGLSSVTLAGNLVGGTFSSTGLIQTAATLGKLVIKGSLIGGVAPGPLTSGGTAIGITKAGFIEAFTIKSAVIEGDIVAGQNGGAGIVSSGGLRTNLLESLVVGGSLKGNASVPVVITSGGLLNNLAIKSIAIGGDVAFAEILAGYDGATTLATSSTSYNPRGTAWNADASIGTVTVGGNAEAFNVIAGAIAGTDGRFGTADDRVISGSSIRNASNVISQIASVIIRGSVVENAEAFGIVAQSIGLVKFGTPAITVGLEKGAGNDTAENDTDLDPGKLIGVGTNYRALEVPLLPV